MPLFFANAKCRFSHDAATCYTNEVEDYEILDLEICWSILSRQRIFADALSDLHL